MLYLSYISHCNRFHCTVNSVLQYIVHILFYSTSLCSIVHLCVLALFPSGFCVLVRTFHPSVLPQFYTVLTCTTCTACITLYRSVLDLASHRIASQYISVCTSLYVHLCVLQYIRCGGRSYMNEILYRLLSYIFHSSRYRFVSTHVRLLQQGTPLRRLPYFIVIVY